MPGNVVFIMASVVDWAVFLLVYSALFAVSCVVVCLKVWLYLVCCRCVRGRRADELTDQVRFPPPKLQERMPSRNSVYLRTVDGHSHSQRHTH